MSAPLIDEFDADAFVADSIAKYGSSSTGGKKPTRARGTPILLTPSECEASDPRGYIIKGLLAPYDFGIVFGEPGAGKSIITPHLAYAVAQGRWVFGRRVRQGAVVYVAAEDPHGMRQRIAGLKLTHGDAPDFRLLCDGPDLREDPSSHRAFLTAACATLRPVLVVVDTLKAAFPAIQENDSAEMDVVINLARDIAADGPAVILVHHSPKGGDTPRGHGSLNGDADVSIRVAVEALPRISGTILKNRNGPSGTKLAFDIKVVATGVDEDGDPITAPVAAEEEEATRRPAKIRLSPQEQRAIGFLFDVLIRDGKPLPSDGWHPTRLGIHEDAWREECERRSLSTSDDPKNRRKVVSQAFAKLLEKRVIAARDHLVWVTEPGDDLQRVTDSRYATRNREEPTWN